jgi:hypothetical protein
MFVFLFILLHMLPMFLILYTAIYGHLLSAFLAINTTHVSPGVLVV